MVWIMVRLLASGRKSEKLHRKIRLKGYYVGCVFLNLSVRTYSMQGISV